jgi:hypothetical protein
MTQEIEYFKAAKQTHRWNANQKVWVVFKFANFLKVRFKWRGKGRYVNGLVARWNNPAVGELKKIEVTDEFANRIRKERQW